MSVAHINKHVFLMRLWVSWDSCWSQLVSYSIRTAVTKYHRLGAYKQQKFISHRSGNWEMQCQGAGRFGA